MKTSYLPALLCLTLGSQAPGKGVPSNASANLVLGQSDFVTGTIRPQSSFSSNRPEGVVIDPITGKVFVSENNANRVLRYANADALANGAGAEAVFGQQNFGGPGAVIPLANSMSGPIGMHFDHKGRLWVCDAYNNRVLMFEAASYASNQPYPDRVFGQQDFDTNGAGSTSQKMSTPIGVHLDNDDRLWVADTGNNRVLYFNQISSKTNGAAADGVLGQPGFGTSNFGNTNATMSGPYSVTVSSNGAVFVADSSNNRVLRFDNAVGIGNGGAASGVLGQANFVANASALTASGMSRPTGVALDANGALWVTDYYNERLIRFDKAASAVFGAAAKAVVGQPDFVTNTPAVTESGSIFSFCKPCFDPKGNLWIADTEHFRVLGFPVDATKPTLTVTSLGPVTTTTSSSTKIRGTAADANGIFIVSYSINGGSKKTATGTTKWNFTVGLSKGLNTIKIYSVDSVNNASTTKTLKVTRSGAVK
ncbi:MAG: hypothetical protein ABIS50_05705 [Luteolibacter sp.]|uniref:hypothetical protein n=1 Tax=Luteolibacter sp. TaxID=1962973 RepID=UPI003265080C